MMVGGANAVRRGHRGALYFAGVIAPPTLENARVCQWIKVWFQRAHQLPDIQLASAPVSEWDGIVHSFLCTIANVSVGGWTPAAIARAMEAESNTVIDRHRAEQAAEPSERAREGPPFPFGWWKLGGLLSWLIPGAKRETGI